MNLQVQSEHKSFNGIQGVYLHEATSTACEMTFSVYVPQHEKGETLPVLFYLSGLTCTQENVTTKSGFQRYASDNNMIIVCPDTSPRGSNFKGEHEAYDFGSGAGFYLNATRKPWSENYQMYRYIVEELPKVIESNFPADLNTMGIFGHSMGGHGALTIGLRNPSLFKSISAFSPIVAPMQCAWGQKAYSGYLGSNRDEWQCYDATQLILDGHTSSFPILIDQGMDDDFLTDQLKPALFVDACKKKQQNVELRMQPGYDHSYYFISSFMQDHIEFHAKNLGSLG